MYSVAILAQVCNTLLLKGDRVVFGDPATAKAAPEVRKPHREATATSVAGPRRCRD